MKISSIRVLQDGTEKGEEIFLVDVIKKLFDKALEIGKDPRRRTKIARLKLELENIVEIVKKDYKRWHFEFSDIAVNDLPEFWKVNLDTVIQTLVLEFISRLRLTDGKEVGDEVFWTQWRETWTSEFPKRIADLYTETVMELVKTKQ